MQDARKEERERLGEEAPPKLVPKTIDSMREKDVTTVGGETGRVFTDKKFWLYTAFFFNYTYAIGNHFFSSLNETHIHQENMDGKII